MADMVKQNNKEIIDVIKQESILEKDFKIYGSFENPLFLAKDVAVWIDYDIKSVHKMLSVVDEDEKGRKIFPTLGGPQEAWFVTEEGLYEILMMSKKPIAREFKKEVKKVLKSIRKNGGYIANQENMSPAEIVAHALIVANNIIAEKDKTITEQKEVIEYQGLKLNNFNLAEANRRSKKELRAELNKAIRLLAEQKFEKDYAVAYSHIYDEFSKMHCIDREKINIDYLSKNNDYLAECLTLATSELL